VKVRESLKKEKENHHWRI